MKIKQIDIKNYKSWGKTTIYPNNTTALVGRNNSGKSNLLKALEMFFENSIKLVDIECYHHYQTGQEIAITLTFYKLNDWERSQLQPWMCGEELIIRRRIKCSEDESSHEISTYAIMKVPELEWLQNGSIIGENITKWWAQRDDLRINGLNFAATLGGHKPSVAEWKEAAKVFVEEHEDVIGWKVVEQKNPTGYANVLKGTLPEFIFVPAVRDITEEAKVTKTNPFGKLINSVLGRIAGEQRRLVDSKLSEIEQMLNRTEGNTRISEIKTIETILTRYISSIMKCDVEIEMKLPRLQQIFGEAKIYVDDGVRTTIGTKGNGMQRSMIFSILRAYAELTRQHESAVGEKRRTTIFAIEEPELYLHPQLQRTLMSVLYDIGSGEDQVFYSTQSNLFVDIRYFDNICIIRRDKKDEKYCSNTTQLFMSALIEDLKARKGIDGTSECFREQYSHAFNPMINEGFFADKVVIVEGPSEQYSLPIYADALGYEDYNLDRLNISVVHSEGKGQIDRLLRVFNGFKIPTYCWFDGDKDNNDSNVKNKTLEILELLGDPVASIDDLETKITAKYAVMKNTLEDTLRDEIPDYAEIVSKASTEIIPATKPLTSRYVANSLKKIVENGTPPEDVLPKSIVGIVKAVKELSYTDTVLKRLE